MEIKKGSDCNNLDEIRAGIDYIDNRIVELIAQRSDYVKEAAKFKKTETAVRDEERVKKVISSKKELAAKYGISPDLIATIYTEMINFFVKEEISIWKNQSQTQ